MVERTLFVGDVHGCLTELEGLLNLAGFLPKQDRLFFVGDLINRGPDSLGVLKLVHHLGASSVLGNHEQSFLSFLKNGSKTSANFEKLKQEMGDQAGFWEDWLESLPLFVSEGEENEKDSFLVVHAGIAPGILPQKTEPRLLTKLRTWDPENCRPGDDIHPAWYELYHDSRMIIFGHWAAGGIVMRQNVIGLDSGCVYGRSLTALSWPDRILHQYPAQRIYHHPQS